MAHSPFPWTTRMGAIFDANGEHVLCESCEEVDNREDAELVVKLVNEYYKSGGK